MAHVVVRATLHLPARHRQQRLRAVERLDLTLFIDADDHCVLGRTHVQPDDVAHLLDDVGITREFEGL